MNQTMTISEARSELPAISRHMARHAKPHAVAITQKGKPVLAVMNWEMYESIIETLEILGDPEAMAALRQGIQEAKDGKEIPWGNREAGTDLNYTIEIQPTALAMLRSISDRSIRAKIVERIDALASEPEKIGKPLREELAGFRSIRAAGQRYRIIYRVDRQKLKVMIMAAGIRKEGDRHDIYYLAQKLVRLGLAER